MNTCMKGNEVSKDCCRRCCVFRKESVIAIVGLVLSPKLAVGTCFHKQGQCLDVMNVARSPRLPLVLYESQSKPKKKRHSGAHYKKKKHNMHADKIKMRSTHDQDNSS